MPELPEVESARQVLERALHRRITEVDDTDTYVCRPHVPGEIAAALRGGELVAAHRVGKSLWCETTTADGDAGPRLGIHLGMSGRIYVLDPEGPHVSGGRYGGGEPFLVAGDNDKPVWTRFRITFADGGELTLFDKRRLGRVRLEPDIHLLGPDAQQIGREELRERVGASLAPIKARLMDQTVVAGIGNLLADEVLWQAMIRPSRPARDVTAPELDRLWEALGRAIDSAIAMGGVHTGEVVAARKRDGTCPRCGAPMERATVGGRTTYWCSREQA
ncbi:DNA-formamidopyrimidine glycosylase family protein [Rhodococcus sp. X156]|uniref:Fpg/Nei family DNA glycosylase n=1 Tax=Rhodococcus sp. X156 TaxID=2499145 RepID=UPI000FD83183|nr:DNA-formamidopyrimidine glycosylase family protein [Rhodococcus sp. X156]